MRKSSVFLILACLVVLAFADRGMGSTPIRLVTNVSGVDPYERWERIAAAFHADRPDYHLDVEVVSGTEYPTKISLMVASGTSPDVFQTWGQYKALWAEQGLLMDLTPLWEQSAVAQGADIFPFMMEAAVYDGKIVGIPYDFSGITLTVNLDALREAGLPVPAFNWTVQEFRDYAIRLTRPDQGIYGTDRSDTRGNWIWAVNFTGDGWLSEDRKEVLVQSPGYIELLEYWLDLIELGAAPPPGRAASRSSWEGGYGFWQGWAHYGQNLERAATYDWAMVPFPKGPVADLHFAHGHMWSLPSNAEHPERGWVFLEWLLSPEGQRAIVTLDGRQPLSNDPDLWALFFSAVRSSEKQAMLYELVIGEMYGKNRIHTMQYWTAWPEAERIMQSYLDRVFRGLESPVSAMEKAATELRASAVLR